MRKKFKVLQIGQDDFGEEFKERSDVYWTFIHEAEIEHPDVWSERIKQLIKKTKSLDFIFLQTNYSEQLMNVLKDVITPYNTYVDSMYWEGYRTLDITREMLIREFSSDNKEHLIDKIKSISFVGQYGDKIHATSIVPNTGFDGEVTYLGSEKVSFTGNFGSEFKPLASWKYNIFYEKNKVLELWPEFKLIGVIDLQLRFRKIPSGVIDTITEEFCISLNDLTEPIKIPRQDNEAYYSVTIEAKGNGTIILGAFHRRWSRLEFGDFLLGGKRFSDSDGEEFIYFFHPGDLKPPLNVYFSGYRTAEGFEGYFLMNLFHAPFLLIGDPRLEGGSFYMGSEEYEQGIKDVIMNTLDQLGFKEDDLILSGLSMGSFGSLYYGSQLNPAAVIAGKPLVNIGTIADNMKLLRPNDFGTANDMLMSLTGGTTQEHIYQLDQKFWNVFEAQDLTKTTFGISYMENDDYDLYAFNDLLNVLSKQHAKTISRGILGRHNDDSATINNWFIHFFNIMLETKFGRLPYDRKV